MRFVKPSELVLMYNTAAAVVHRIAISPSYFDNFNMTSLRSSEVCVCRREGMRRWWRRRLGPSLSCCRSWRRLSMFMGRRVLMAWYGAVAPHCTALQAQLISSKVVISATTFLALPVSHEKWLLHHTRGGRSTETFMRTLPATTSVT